MIDPERLATLTALQDRLGYTFQSVDLLDQALTHKSCTKWRDSAHTGYDNSSTHAAAPLICCKHDDFPLI